jgi:hypothetical protein
MARRQHVTVLFALAVMALITLSYMISSSGSAQRIPSPDEFSGRSSGNGIVPAQHVDVPPDVLSGGVIAPKLENATAKYVQVFRRCRMRPLPWPS